MSNRVQNFIFYTLAVAIFCTFGFFALLGENGFYHLMSLKQKKNDLIRQNRSLLEKTLEARQEIQALRDPKMIEIQARKNMGFVFEDEVVFILPK